MATTKKTGIVATVTEAIGGMFSSDDAKQKPTAKKAVKSGTGAVKKAVKTAAKTTPAPAKKAAKKVATSATKKVAPSTKKAATTKNPPKKAPAAKRSMPGTSMDRKLIALSEPYEVRDWAKSMGCTVPELRAAVAAVGNSAAKVRAHLKK